jgi:hypothetical protein
LDWLHSRRHELARRETKSGALHVSTHESTMPIRREPVNADPICEGHEWVVEDQTELARIVAHLILGQHIHAKKVLDRLQPKVPPRGVDAIERAISTLTLQAGEDPWHRDGWIMQFISWVVCYKHRSGRAAVRAPQPRCADKGFDGLVIEVDDSGQTSILVCEDKATDRPRETFRDKVIPEIKRLEAGERDAELLSDVSGLLEMAFSDFEVTRILSTIDFASARRYRVSLSTRTGNQTSDSMKKIFDGFEKAAPGAPSRRSGETVCMDPLRGWMDDFCRMVINQLKRM